jgi:hypothetical protein
MDEPKQKRTRVEREEWAKRVERWRDGDLTTAEFAAELGINPKTLTYSAWTLKREAGWKEASLVGEEAADRGGAGRAGTEPDLRGASAPRLKFKHRT